VKIEEHLIKQIWDLVCVAEDVGLYDAADWIRASMKDPPDGAFLELQKIYSRKLEKRLAERNERLDAIWKILVGGEEASGEKVE
jgi:hypothetical protein